MSARQALRWLLISQERRWLGSRAAPAEWESLSAWRGLVHQAYQSQPLQPNLCCDLWYQGAFCSPLGRKAFFTPNRREREPSSHHYGHDIQIKRHAGLPLVGAPLPVLLEHGLKVAATSRFDEPKPWASRGYLCMGPLRARWLQEQQQVPATAIGPWIRYAKTLLSREQLEAQRGLWGPSLLVILAHSWDRVERSMDRQACIGAIKTLCRQEGYRTVIWLRHWQDPATLPLPQGWITACNGHRSNPWFLDALRTLLELSDGVASNAFGTHLGYAAMLHKTIHWIPVGAEQKLGGLPPEKASREIAEWQERERLSSELISLLQRPGHERSADLNALLEPYWGLSIERSPQEMRALLSGREPETKRLKYRHREARRNAQASRKDWQEHP